MWFFFWIDVLRMLFFTHLMLSCYVYHRPSKHWEYHLILKCYGYRRPSHGYHRPILCIGILPSMVTTGKCHLVLKHYDYHRSAFTIDLVVISHAASWLQAQETVCSAQ